MAFARDVKLWQPPTGDPRALSGAVERIQQLGYATNLYDGLFSACLDQFPPAREHDAGAARHRALQRRRGYRKPARNAGCHRRWPSAERSRFCPVRPRQAQGRAGRRGAAATGRRNRRTALRGQLRQRFPGHLLRHGAADANAILRLVSASSSRRPDFTPCASNWPAAEKLRVRARQGYYFDAP